MRPLLFSVFLIISINIHSNWQVMQFANSKVHLFVPKNLASSSPLMMNLHGCAQKAQALVDHGNWEEAATKYRTIVAIPEVPGGGVISGCWDYYGMDHNRNNRHNGFILKLVEKLKNKFSINSKKVFITGLSSGGGESFVLGCLAPDVFSGIGLNATPSVGTTSIEISRAKISKEEIIKNCTTLAAKNRSLLRSQKVSIIYGDNDYLVDRKYSSLNADSYAQIIGATVKTSFDVTKLKGSKSEGTGTHYGLEGQAPVVSLIENVGLGHNWPAGQGAKGISFVNKESINYPEYLLKFFLVKTPLSH